MSGDCRPQKPYSKRGNVTIYKVEITQDTFEYICKKLKVTRIGDKQINEILDQADNVEETTCCSRDEEPDRPE